MRCELEMTGMTHSRPAMRHMGCYSVFMDRQQNESGE